MEYKNYLAIFPIKKKYKIKSSNDDWKKDSIIDGKNNLDRNRWKKVSYRIKSSKKFYESYIKFKIIIVLRILANG